MEMYWKNTLFSFKVYKVSETHAAISKDVYLFQKERKEISLESIFDKMVTKTTNLVKGENLQIGQTWQT